MRRTSDTEKCLVLKLRLDGLLDLRIGLQVHRCSSYTRLTTWNDEIWYIAHVASSRTVIWFSVSSFREFKGDTHQLLCYSLRGPLLSSEDFFRPHSSSRLRLRSRCREKSGWLVRLFQNDWCSKSARSEKLLDPRGTIDGERPKDGRLHTQRTGQGYFGLFLSID